MGTYHGGQHVDQAQQTLERHAVSSADGLCLACRVPGPCVEHEAAVRLFMFSARLPRRVPGATRPELIGARRLDSSGLFAEVT